MIYWLYHSATAQLTTCFLPTGLVVLIHFNALKNAKKNNKNLTNSISLQYTVKNTALYHFKPLSPVIGPCILPQPNFL